MKQLLILLCCLALMAIDISAQVFAPVGAKWYYTQATSNPNKYSYTTIESTGDTSINSISCKKLEKINFETGVGETFFMYSDSNRVYFYNSNTSSFCLLYDFNLSIQDTFYLDCYTLNQQPLQVVITDEDSVLIDNIYFKAYYYYAPSLAADFTGWVIEHIGHQNYMFPLADQGALNYLTYPLRCYQDSLISYRNENYYPFNNWSNSNCGEIIYTSISKVLKVNINTYPNPVNNTWYIQSEKPASVSFYELSGKQILQTHIESGANQIGVSSLNTGVYFYRILNESGSVIKSGKVVKTK